MKSTDLITKELADKIIAKLEALQAIPPGIPYHRINAKGSINPQPGERIYTPCAIENSEQVQVELTDRSAKMFVVFQSSVLKKTGVIAETPAAFEAWLDA